MRHVCCDFCHHLVVRGRVGVETLRAHFSYQQGTAAPFEFCSQKCMDAFMLEMNPGVARALSH